MSPARTAGGGARREDRRAIRVRRAATHDEEERVSPARTAATHDDEEARA